MWTTNFKHENGGVTAITHDFGNQVKVETDFKKGTTRRIHGAIVVNEKAVDKSVERYHQMLDNIDKEVNPCNN